MPEQDERALRAAIVQDATTGRVLMLGWMDDEALEATRRTGLVHFYSRSRARLWQKGETSGNRLHTLTLTPDCDGDALLVTVRPEGPTCHSGTQSCFAPWLWRDVVERVRTRPAGSYTAALAEEGIDRIAQKVGEEAVETVLAAVGGDPSRLVEELADLWYHCLVLLAASGVDIAAVEDELVSRRRPPRSGVTAGVPQAP